MLVYLCVNYVLEHFINTIIYNFVLLDVCIYVYIYMHFVCLYLGVYNHNIYTIMLYFKFYINGMYVHGIVAQVIICEEGPVAATAKLSFVPRPLLKHWMLYWSGMWSIVMTIIVFACI